MDVYLNLEFNENVDPGILFTIAKELTFSGIRTSVGSEKYLIELFKVCKDLNLNIMLLIPDELVVKNQEEELIKEVKRITNIIYNADFPLNNLILEIVNEPLIFNEFWKNNPEQLGHAFNRCVDIIKTKLPELKVVAPNIPNLGSRDIKYLTRMLSTIDKNKSFSIGIHRYPAYLSDWYSAHREYGSRDQEVEELKKVIGAREFLVTETGCSQNYKEKRIGKDKIINISEKDQTNYCKKELSYWKNKYVPIVVWYQLNDGPDSTEILDGFGIRRFDNTPKDIWLHMAELLNIVNKT